MYYSYRKDFFSFLFSLFHFFFFFFFFFNITAVIIFRLKVFCTFGIMENEGEKKRILKPSLHFLALLLDHYIAHFCQHWRRDSDVSEEIHSIAIFSFGTFNLEIEFSICLKNLLSASNFIIHTNLSLSLPLFLLPRN